MSILENIENDLKDALRNKDEKRLSVLRMVKNSLKNKEIEKGSALDSEEEINILKKEAKNRKDSITQYENGSRKDLAQKENEELEIIETYLPKGLGDEEIRKIVVTKIEQLGEDNFGKIMGSVMGEVGASADGAEVKKIVEEELSKRSQH